MKIYISALFVLAAFAQACTTNTLTPANNGVSNTNSPINNSAVVVKTENSPAANAEKNIKNTATKTEKSTTSGTSGQNPERVQFAAGKTDTDLKRDIPANGSIDLIFNARSGQRMQYSVNYENGADTDIETFLTEPGLQDISNTSAANENNEFMIKKTGDHRITIQNKTGKKVNIDFGLSVK